MTQRLSFPSELGGLLRDLSKAYSYHSREAGKSEANHLIKGIFLGFKAQLSAALAHPQIVRGFAATAAPVAKQARASRSKGVVPVAAESRLEARL